MQKQSKTLFKNEYATPKEQAQANSLLDQVIEEPIGTSIEEVFEYKIVGKFDITAVHPDGKCGSTEQYDTNYNINLSFNKELSQTQFYAVKRYIQEITKVFSQLQKGQYYWKASCEEIANHLVVQLQKLSINKMKPVEIIVAISPNHNTTVKTHWQDHMALPRKEDCANPQYSIELPQQYYRSGCG